MRERQYYLIQLQFLGFRYSGWQKQPGQKTIEGMLSKTLKYILPHRKFKILGAGRTDAKVSALEAAFELFLEGSPIEDHGNFLNLFNNNLPPDIKIIKVSKVDKNFNIIQHVNRKEYAYLFSFGEKNHPFCAPYMAHIPHDLDIELMKEAALLFRGTHNFKSYTAKPRENTQFVRSVVSCEIRRNTILKANFFPKNSYVLGIRSAGFMRYQVRMIMGALVQLGRGELSMSDIKISLKENSNVTISFVAPGSGLMLNTLEFKNV